MKNSKYIVKVVIFTVMQIYKTLLECSFGLKILYYEESQKKVQVKEGTFSKTQSCYIGTDNGSIKIAINLTVNKAFNNDDLKGVYTAKFLNDLKDVSDEEVHSLISGQLDVEIFLNHNDSKNIQYVCESF